MIKLLNLILYSETSPEYIEMYKLLSTYLKANNIPHYFYAYKNIEKDYEIVDDIIYLKGTTESIVPGCLDKTIKVFDICKNMDFDYLVRSNISTVINFKNFFEILNKISTKFDYAGAGIGSHDNIQFASGCCMIFSKKIVQLLVSNKITIDYRITDDVSIAKFLNGKVNIVSFGENRVDNVEEARNGIVFYRNKHSVDRNIDIKNMKKIIDTM
jgi:hypothetical protein